MKNSLKKFWNNFWDNRKSCFGQHDVVRKVIVRGGRVYGGMWEGTCKRCGKYFYWGPAPLR